MKNRGMWNSKMNLQSQPGASAWAMTIRIMAMPLAIDIVVSLFTMLYLLFISTAMAVKGCQTIRGISAILCGNDSIPLLLERHSFACHDQTYHRVPWLSHG